MDVVNLKPIEQKQQTDDNDNDDKEKTNQQVNVSERIEENVESIKSLDSETELKREENKVAWDDSDGLLNKFEMLCSNLDLGTWISQDTNISTTTNSVSSSSMSLDDTSHISIDESSYFQQNSLHQWVDNMDSILSWDAFNPLDQDISFFEK